MILKGQEIRKNLNEMVMHLSYLSTFHFTNINGDANDKADQIRWNN